MFIIVEGQIIREHLLTDVVIEEDPANAGQFRVVNNPENPDLDKRELKGAMTKADAQAYMKKVQDALVAEEFIQTVDLR